MYESNEEIIEKVAKIATAKGANVSESDISIAHPLPTRKHHPRTMIVRKKNRQSRSLSKEKEEIFTVFHDKRHKSI